MKSVLNSIKRFCRQADMFLLAMCLVCSIFGMVLIISATHSWTSTRHLWVQGGAIALGVVLYIAFSLIDMDDLARFWKLILVFNILFVSSTYFFGELRNGNRSWVEIPFIGVMAQPAEVVKISFIVLLARQMYVQREHISSVKSVLLLGGHLALMAGLIWFAADDMGMVVVYVFIFVCMAFAAGIKVWWFLGFGGAIAAAVPLIWRALGDYQRMRIMVVLDSSLDPLGIGWQAARSKLALGSGQLTGQGLFNGRQTQQGVLPEKQTDFIYSVAGEELGMVGCVAILLLLVIVIVRCLYVASRAKNGAGALVCVGVASMLIFQVFENIGMCVGLTPVVGITLPFFSYGGSSIITMFAAMGMVSGVRMRPMPGWLKTTERNRRG